MMMIVDDEEEDDEEENEEEVMMINQNGQSCPCSFLVRVSVCQCLCRSFAND